MQRRIRTWQILQVLAVGCLSLLRTAHFGSHRRLVHGEILVKPFM